MQTFGKLNGTSLPNKNVNNNHILKTKNSLQKLTIKKIEIPFTGKNLRALLIKGTS